MLAFMRVEMRPKMDCLAMVFLPVERSR